MGKSTEDLVLAFRVLTNPEFEHPEISADPYCISKRFDLGRYQSGGKLKIGFFASHSSWPVDPAGQRAVRMAAEALKNRGHEVVEFEMACFQEVIEEYLVLINAFGPQLYYFLLRGEDPIPEYKAFLLAHRTPDCVKSILSCVLGCFGQRRDSRLVSLMKSLTTQQLLTLLDKQKRLQLEFMESWKQQGLDFVVCPGAGVRAFKHYHSDTSFMYGCYQFVWNYLRLPAGAVPVTLALASESQQPLLFNDTPERRAAASQQGCTGMPAGVQIVGRPYDEEGVLRVMREI